MFQRKFILIWLGTVGNGMLCMPPIICMAFSCYALKGPDPKPTKINGRISIDLRGCGSDQKYKAKTAQYLRFAGGISPVDVQRGFPSFLITSATTLAMLPAGERRIMALCVYTIIHLLKSQSKSICKSLIP